MINKIYAVMELYSRDLMMTNATIGGFYMPGRAGKFLLDFYER